MSTSPSEAPDREFPELAPDADAAEDQYAGLTPLEAAAAKTHPHISMCRLGWTRMDCVTCADELHQIRKYIPAIEAEVRAAALVASGWRREADVLREAADTLEARYPTDVWHPASPSPDAQAARGVRVACGQLRHLAAERDGATALEPAQPLPVAADVCGEVGTSFPNGSYADPAYTEPCALPSDHEEPHDWAQREAAEGQERSEGDSRG